MTLNEADTCRKYVVPALVAAGWDTAPHAINEQKTFTDGKIIFVGGKARRGKQKRADFLLRYRSDFPIAVVEAKSFYSHAAEGLQQAKSYAEILGLRFAYSTNGQEIIEFDYISGEERLIEKFPNPDELWERIRSSECIDASQAATLLAATYPDKQKPLRYYQELAVNRAVQAVAQGKRRILLTLCTGAGKTAVAFQISWKLWSSRWNSKGSNWHPKILFLADRNILVDDPMAKDFRPFGDAREKISGHANKSRDIYFAIYQAIAKDELRPGLYREYPRDFFDLIIIDECHRGSARDESNWREILDWFEPAYKIGMTATPRRADNGDTYDYFGAPLYEYSLAQGIDDGFLAPYRVHRVITDYDAAGWRPAVGDLDRFGREIPDGLYGTKDFERVVALRARTVRFAHHLTNFLKQTDRFAKTLVFCVDQEHALEMRNAIAKFNSDVIKDYPNYVCRVTSDEGDVGRSHLTNFQDIEKRTPTILTTSQMLTTGVDAPTCKNIALARVVSSMSEFKQIIGRGTRLRPDYGKLAFNIIDYTGTAIEKFSDAAFDGQPITDQRERIDKEGDVVDVQEMTPSEKTSDEASEEGPQAVIGGEEEGEAPPRKFYFDGGSVEVIRHFVYELDADGKKLTVRLLTDYTGEKVRTLYPNASELRRDWLDPHRRADIIDRLQERGIDVETLGECIGKPEADVFDLLCHLAYNGPLRSRRERADRLKREEREFFKKYSPEAQQILDAVIEKYAEFGAAQFRVPEILQISPLNAWGNVVEIASRFGGSSQLRDAVAELQQRLYTA